MIKKPGGLPLLSRCQCRSYHPRNAVTEVKTRSRFVRNCSRVDNYVWTISTRRCQMRNCRAFSIWLLASSHKTLRKCVKNFHKHKHTFIDLCMPDVLAYLLTTVWQCSRKKSRQMILQINIAHVTMSLRITGWRILRMRPENLRNPVLRRRLHHANQRSLSEVLVLQKHNTRGNMSGKSFIGAVW